MPFFIPLTWPLLKPFSTAGLRQSGGMLYFFLGSKDKEEKGCRHFRTPPYGIVFWAAVTRQEKQKSSAKKPSLFQNVSADKLML